MMTAEARSASKKGALRHRLKSLTAAAHPDKRLQPTVDEAPSNPGSMHRVVAHLGRACPRTEAFGYHGPIFSAVRRRGIESPGSNAAAQRPRSHGCFSHTSPYPGPGCARRHECRRRRFHDERASVAERWPWPPSNSIPSILKCSDPSTTSEGHPHLVGSTIQNHNPPSCAIHGYPERQNSRALTGIIPICGRLTAPKVPWQGLRADNSPLA